MHHSSSVEPYAYRIEATGEAQKRTRTAFLVSTVVSLAVLVACWNAYVSWYRHFARKTEWMGSFTCQDGTPPVSGQPISADGPPINQSKDCIAPVTEELHKLTVAKWVESQQISIPILGISIGVSDIAVLGSFALFLSAFWLYHTFRRENQAIGHLLIDTKSFSKEDKKQIFHSVAAYSVFTNVDDTEVPISALDEAPRKVRSSTFGRKVFRWMLYLPGVSILISITFDLASIFFIEPVFRIPHDVKLWTLMGPPEWIQFALMEAFALLFCAFSFGLCFRAAEFEQATGEVLADYQKNLKNIPRHNTHP